MDYFISDLHLWHRNIVGHKFEDKRRKFNRIEDMHSEIISKWNEVVNKTDTVYVLGDITFGSKEMTKNILKGLKGNKIMIRGNHDQKSAQWYMDCGFKEVWSKPVIYNDNVILSHEPVKWEHILYNDMFNIHGHLHNEKIGGRYINVACEWVDYKPKSIKEIELDMELSRIYIDI